MMQITYQKNDGCIFQRQRKTEVPYKIGEKTSMGWKVLNIEYKYKNVFYPEYKYHMLKRKEIQSYIKKNQIKETCTKGCKTFLYYLITILLVELIKIILGL